MIDKNKISVYLIKDEFLKNNPSVFKLSSNPYIVIDSNNKVYFAPSNVKVPSWMKSFFKDKLVGASIFVSNARAVLLSRVIIKNNVSKTFAVTMGYGKNMLVEEAIEEDFGLKVVLNSISPNSLRRINKVNIGGNRKASNEQLPLESDIDGFGFDIDRDLISTITGSSNDAGFASGMLTGSDMLSLTSEVDITNITQFLKTTYLQYTSDSYKANFGWIDHIRRVKRKSDIDTLNAKIVQLINQSSPRVWAAVPDVVEWENIQGFKYAGKDLYDDIDIHVIKDCFGDKIVSIDQLKRKHAYAIRSDNGEIMHSWTLYKCLYGEVEFNGSAYCLNNGKWFCVDKDFVQTVEREYNSIPISSFPFIPYRKEFARESDYTQAFVSSNTEHLLNMDAKMIYHGGGQSKVELCDILTTDGSFIHVKPYSGSAALSHLFNQAVVSAELVMGDSEFLAKANLKIQEQTDNGNFLIRGGDKPTVILAIITKYKDLRPPIPFFSKIALRYTTRRLQTYGCKVFIKNIVKESI